MARIQWTPIVAPDISEAALRAQQMAGSAVQGAFGSFTGILNDWEGARQRDEMGQLIARQEAFVGGDSALYDQARRSGALTRGLTYMRPEALAGAVRTFGADLERDYRGDIAFADGRTDRTFTLAERQRGITEREAGIQVALGTERIRAEVAAGRMSEADAVRETAALAAQAATAAQITASYEGVRDGRQDNRGNTTWDRGTTTWNDSRVDRAFTLETREDEQAGFALAQKYVNFQGTNEDLMADPEYQRLRPRAQALALSTLGRGPAPAAEGAPAEGGAGGGSDWTASSGMAASESGNRWNIVNGEGYGGRNQFGAARLADAAAAGLVPRGTTGAQFSRMSPEVQQRVEAWHWGDIDQQAERRGLNRYIGQTVGGVRITQGAIRGMAQIGGIGGAQRFLQTNGRYNPEDSNGTSISDYGARFSRAAVPANTVQRVATDLAVGAGVARASDRFGPQARNIAAALSSDASDQEVMATLRAEGSPFATMPEARVGRILREIQDRHQANGGGRLPRAAAAEVALASITDFDLGKDGWRNLIGRSSGIGSTGGFAASASHTINWTDVDQQLARFRNGGAALASDVRNDENRAGVAAAATEGRAQISALEAEVARLEATAERMNQPNNPVLLERRRRLASLYRQYGAVARDGTAVIRAGAQ